MSATTLCLSRGAVEITRAALANIPAPPPTASWLPAKHSAILLTAEQALAGAGFEIERERLAVSRGGGRFFGTLDLRAPLATGVSLAVGLRNSTDKSLPMGFAAGSRVFVCDNLAFTADLVVRTKHTKLGRGRFSDAITSAVQGLVAFQSAERERIRRLQTTACPLERASHLLVRAAEGGIIPSTRLMDVWSEIQRPSYEYDAPMAGMTLWTVLQAFTTVLGSWGLAQPAQYAAKTMRLNALLSEPQTTMAV